MAPYLNQRTEAGKRGAAVERKYIVYVRMYTAASDESLPQSND